MDLAHAVSRRFKAAVMVAFVLLTAACATGAQLAPSPPMDLARMVSRPAPRSTLVTRRDLHFSVARESDASGTTVLVYEPAQGSPVPVALVVSTHSKDGERVALQRLRLPASHDAALDIAVLEHLYVLAVQQDGRARFCLAPMGQACDAAKHGESHAQVLAELVAARQRAMDEAKAAAGVPWQVVSMAPAPTPGGDADRVAVRVNLAGRPLPGANIFFSRAPHSGCTARSDAAGLAACELVDYHGDDGDEDEGKVPVVATFSGDVRADRALVPTTELLPPHEREALAKGSK